MSALAYIQTGAVGGALNDINLPFPTIAAAISAAVAGAFSSLTIIPLSNYTETSATIDTQGLIVVVQGQSSIQFIGTQLITSSVTNPASELVLQNVLFAPAANITFQVNTTISQSRVDLTNNILHSTPGIRLTIAESVLNATLSGQLAGCNNYVYRLFEAQNGAIIILDSVRATVDVLPPPLTTYTPVLELFYNFASVLDILNSDVSLNLGSIPFVNNTGSATASIYFALNNNSPLLPVSVIDGLRLTVSSTSTGSLSLLPGSLILVSGVNAALNVNNVNVTFIGGLRNLILYEVVEGGVLHFSGIVAPSICIPESNECLQVSYDVVDYCGNHTVSGGFRGNVRKIKSCKEVRKEKVPLCPPKIAEKKKCECQCITKYKESYCSAGCFDKKDECFTYCEELPFRYNVRCDDYILLIDSSAADTYIVLPTCIPTGTNLILKPFALGCPSLNNIYVQTSSGEYFEDKCNKLVLNKVCKGGKSLQLVKYNNIWVSL
ncbi:Hypothetical protein ORPV_991 [Orpheovirus IHUMI-LCC2]|uniref:Uncharacterized protein n=1 Tax=Orpheovirus IHUMI-LCC2 TaxID=2023057 RepID=A0A2I2L5R5_9VIRU|nr:Hypothetical protein ORPV_991 [Orpheovirus IHUMI-LCC2]SNW62895.1 Hypothetical protein ORPV_991 [Orpheovirus IHUMI-LCC2]